MRGVGGAAVALPLLRSVTQHRAVAQGAANETRRLIVMFTHYGCLTDRWFPEIAHGALGANAYLGLSLEPLAPFAAKLLVPRGLRAMNEWNSQMSRGQGNDPHTQVVGSYFTCCPVTPNSDDPFSFETAAKFEAMPMGPSLDHICARQISPNGEPMYLHLGGENPQTRISYSAAETPYAGIGSLQEAYATLTGVLVGGQDSPDSYQTARGKSVLDLIRDDLARLEGYDMSASDRKRLEAWRDLLHDTGKIIASAACSDDQAAALGLAHVSGGTEPSSVDISAKLDGSERDTADLFSNIAALAAVCNVSPVTFLNYPGPYVYSGLGLTMDSHALSHRVANANMAGACLIGVDDLLGTIDRFYANKFANLVRVLDSVSEGEGTVLDNMAAVWFQELSDGNAHNLNNIPVIQAGSCGGYFKTGVAVNLDGEEPQLSRGVSSTACDGGLATTTATDPSLANAPINKYFCNLMNALGVKAGADGFPLVGGTSEVTHYGMYDKTEDFIGGGTNPPMIHDPGEFEQLRA